MPDPLTPEREQEIRTRPLARPMCPVCGYAGDAEFRPFYAHLRGCCGSEFELDDGVATHDELRDTWIADGCPWFDFEEMPQGEWSPAPQLNSLYRAIVDAERLAHAETRQQLEAVSV